MFIVTLSYIKPLSDVEKLIDEHIDYLNNYYEQGVFVLSGRKVPRTGGVILVNAQDSDFVDKIIKEDPFFIGEVAEYSVIEFVPSKAAEGLEQFIQT